MKKILGYGFPAVLLLIGILGILLPDQLNALFGAINTVIATVLFFDVLFFVESANIPFAVAWLVVGAIFFTFKMGFINIRLFKHAIELVMGKYDDPNNKGEVSHFEALSTALSATVGLGNIAGVAIAISLGGPGATFWMIVAGFLGMSSKFVECSLGQMYRETRHDGHVMGGPMEYLAKGLSEVGKAGLGKTLSIIFALMCIGGAFGGGTTFQVNQSLDAIQTTIPFFADYRWVYGIIMAILVGVVLIGGIKRIANVAEAIVPSMCGIYVVACLYILGMNFSAVPEAFGLIFSSAFSFEAGFGGFVGVLVQGFKRAAFSNEAGVGSASIAHSTAKTKHPVEEGVVALLEPFIDTIVVCTMTALVIVITGAYANPDWAQFVEGNNGAALTSMAFGSQISWFPYLLSLAVFLFAFSTIISWSYYGERCFSYLFDEEYSIFFKIALIAAVFMGSIFTATNVLDFGDLMILGMSVPNIFGIYFLSGKVKEALGDYLAKLKSGEIKKHA